MLKKTLITVLVIAAIAGAWFLYNYLTGNRAVTMELLLDSTIEKFEVYDVRDDQSPVATIFPVFDGRKMEVPLKVYQSIHYQRTLRSIYYFFIIYTASGASKSDTFTLDKHSDRVKLSIGPSGNWQILNQ